jgi:hypothetical protein
MDCAAPSGDDNVDLETGQLRGEMSKSIGFRFAPADFENDVFSLDKAQLAQTLPECVNPRRRHGGGRAR